MQNVRDALATLIDEAATREDRLRLEDATRAAELVARIASAEDRRSILSVLEKLDVITALADDVAAGRLVPFPRERRRSKTGPGAPFYVDDQS